MLEMFYIEDMSPTLHEVATSPMFVSIQHWLKEFSETTESMLETCNRLAETRDLRSEGGHPIRFVPPGHDSYKYEARIFLMGDVETRESRQHDLFNACVWLAFPQTKAVINGRHYASLLGRGVTGQRSGVEDALTLLDENGVAVLSSEPDLISFLKNSDWKTLFWKHRERLARSARFFLFGHGLLEKALQPYVGLCGHSLIFNVKPSFFGLSNAEQLYQADGLMAAYLRNEPQFNASHLYPLPLLGMPGFFRDNANEKFYDNKKYFRPKRSPGKESVFIKDF